MARAAVKLEPVLVLALLAWLALACLACEDETNRLDFEIHFASPALADRAQRLEARILLGGCDGDEALYSASFTPDEQGALPEALGDGRFGFDARALDASCRWYAAGCRELDLPRGGAGSAVVMLEALPTPALDCSHGCDDGACIMGADAAPSDAGPRDAGPRDAGPRDAEPADVVPPADAGPPVMLELEAESADPLRAPLMRIDDEMVSGGAYVSYAWTMDQTLEQRNMLKRNAPPADDDADGLAIYSFELPAAGEYRLWGRVQVPTLEEDSFWLRIDGGAWIQWNDISHETPWHWDNVRPFERRNEPFLIPLTAGAHQLVLSYRELGARLDKFLLTNDPAFVPSG